MNHGPKHHRTAEERARIERRLVEIWNSDPEITCSALAERFRLSGTYVGDVLAQALKDGRTTRSTKPAASDKRRVKRTAAGAR